MKHQTTLPMFAGILIALIFGFSFMFTAQALTLVSPFQLLGFRFATAAIVLTLLLKIGGYRLNYQGKNWSILIWLAAFQPVTYFIAETLGIKLTSSSEAGMMLATIPVVVTALGAIFLQENPRPLQWLSILISVSGVVLIVFMGANHQTRAHIMGLIILLGAVLSASIYNVLSRKSSSHFAPLEITFVMMWTGAIFFNTIAIIQQYLAGNLRYYFTPLATLPVLIAVLYLGILSSILAFFLLNFMLSKLPVSQGSVFNNLTTIVSIGAGIFFRHEPFLWFHLVGTLGILIGVWGTNYFSPKNQTPPAIEEPTV